MPVFPVTAFAPYDGAFEILNAVRARLHDLMPSLFPNSGSILDTTQASTQQHFNNGYRRFQDELTDAGAERFKGDIVIPNIPATTNFDPASLSSIDWFGCFDGTNRIASPVLPSDLVLPLWMSERPAGSMSAFPDPDQPNMRCRTDGLWMGQKTQRNCQWEWRGDVIYYPGATCVMDFRIGYRLYLPDIIDVGTTRWFQQAVPLMRCSDPLAWWICTEFATAEAARPGVSPMMMQLALSCKAEAMAATKLWSNRDVMKNERTEVRRIPYGGGSRGQGSYRRY